MGIIGDCVYDFTLDSLKTLTPHLYQVVSWNENHYPILNTAYTYENREQELIRLLEAGHGFPAVSAI